MRGRRARARRRWAARRRGLPRRGHEGADRPHGARSDQPPRTVGRLASGAARVPLTSAASRRRGSAGRTREPETGARRCLDAPSPRGRAAAAAGRPCGRRRSPPVPPDGRPGPASVSPCGGAAGGVEPPECRGAVADAAAEPPPVPSPAELSDRAEAAGGRPAAARSSGRLRTCVEVVLVVDTAETLADAPRRAPSAAVRRRCRVVASRRCRRRRRRPTAGCRRTGGDQAGATEPSAESSGAERAPSACRSSGSR